MDNLKPIGNLIPENPFFLAPMDAVNCAAFRLLCRKRGASIVFTSLIDADKFREYADENSDSEAIKKFVNPQAEEQPLAVQLVGANIDNLLFAADALRKHCALIDFNAGCPLGEILGKKGGAYLMKHPDQLYRILKELRENIDLPLTIKLRAGWDEKSINAVEIAKEAEKIGIDAVAIHGRTRKQLYQKKSDWSLTAKAKKSMKIPVIHSGDVFNAYTADLAFKLTKCDYIMMGRAARANPSVFSQLNEYHKSEIPPQKPVKLYNKREANPILDFDEFLRHYKKIEDRYNFSEIRDHALWTAADCRNSKEVKQRILGAKDEKELISVVNSLVF